MCCHKPDPIKTSTGMVCCYTCHRYLSGFQGKTRHTDGYRTWFPESPKVFRIAYDLTNPQDSWKNQEKRKRKLRERVMPV